MSRILNHLIYSSFTTPVPTLAMPMIIKPIVRRNNKMSVENSGSPKVVRKTTNDNIIRKDPEMNLVAFPRLLSFSLLIEALNLAMPDIKIINVNIYIITLKASLV